MSQTETESPLNKYTVPELKGFADQYGTELKTSWGKPQIIKALENDGVNADFIEEKLAEEVAADEEEGEYDNDAFDEPEVVVDAPVDDVDDEDLVLVKMLRANNTYEIRGHRFTREHPFALMKSEDADYLIEVDGGFQMASPREASEYYR